MAVLHEIVTPRLRLLALDQGALEVLLVAPDRLPGALHVPLAPGLVEGPARDAIEAKVAIMRHTHRSRHAWHTYWLMVREPEGLGVGLVGFKGAPDAEGRVELGYGTAPGQRGQGLTTEAGRGLIHWALAQPACLDVIAETHRENLASQRVLQKAGLHRFAEDSRALLWSLRKQDAGGWRASGRSMTSLERLRARLAGHEVDRVPNLNIMMIYAAHEIGAPLSRYYQDHRVLAHANLAVLDRYALDVVQVISDPYREAADWGARVEFPYDGLPTMVRPLLDDPTDLDRLATPDPSRGRRMSDRLEAVSLLRQQVGGQVPVMGWVEGALAEAADLRGVANLLTDLYDRPEWVAELLERCVEVEVAFARAQVEAGADIIGLGDAVASQIAPAAYRRWALPYEQRILAAVREMGVLTRLHICGDTTRILSDMAESGADIIDLDWMVDMAAGAEAFRERAAPCGNIDPVAALLRGTPEEVARQTIATLRRGGPRSLGAAGCEVPDGTPPENLRAQSEALVTLGASGPASSR